MLTEQTLKQANLTSGSGVQYSAPVVCIIGIYTDFSL